MKTQYQSKETCSSIRNFTISSDITLYIFILCIFVFVTYIKGTLIKPVAEDFIPPRAFLSLDSNSQFRPFFAIYMLLIEKFFQPLPQNPTIYHIFTVIVHMITTIEVFIVSMSLTRLKNLSMMASILFTFYPRHHEAILWPAASLHAVMTACVLLSLICYIYYHNSKRYYWYIGSIIFFTTGLLSSEAGGIFFLILLSYNFFQIKIEDKKISRQTFIKSLCSITPFIIVVCIYILTLILTSSTSRLFANSSDKSFYHFSIGMSKFKDIAGYISYTLFPFVPLRMDSFLLKVTLLIISSIFIVVSFVSRSNLTRFGIIWMIVSIIPYALLVPFGNSDRYFYLPSIGFCLAIVGVLQSIDKVTRLNHKRVLKFNMYVLLLFLYSTCSFSVVQNRIQEWVEAGEITDNILTQVYQQHPSIKQNSVFYFINLPKQHKQAKLMGTGIGWALRDHYQQPTLEVRGSDDMKIMTAVYKAVIQDSYNNNMYLYVYEDNKLVDMSIKLSDPNLRNLLFHEATPR